MGRVRRIAADISAASGQIAERAKEFRDLRLQDKPKEIAAWELVVLARSHRPLVSTPSDGFSRGLSGLGARHGQDQCRQRLPELLRDNMLVPRRAGRPRGGRLEQSWDEGGRLRFRFDPSTSTGKAQRRAATHDDPAPVWTTTRRPYLRPRPKHPAP